MPHHFRPLLGRSRPQEFTAREITNIRIPSAVPDQTLGADAYLPDADRPVPAVVTLYSSPKDGFGGLRHRRYLRYFAERGFAAVYVDCRGYGSSDGVPQPMVSPEEIADGEHVIDWVARQPWCDGSVGLWGLSHAGMITLGVAARRPPALKAICPIMGLTDIETDLVHPAGLRGGMVMFGHLSTYDLLSGFQLPLRSHDYQNRMQAWKQRIEEFTPWFVDAWQLPPGSAEWRQRAIDVSAITAPTFCVAGWRDLFCDAMIRAYENITAPKMLLAGPWTHTFPEAAKVGRANAAAIVCQWWDRWLHHGTVHDSKSEPVTFYVQGHEPRWVQAASWPPPTSETTYVATTEGGLFQREPASERSTSANATTAVLSKSLDPTVGVLSGLSVHSALNFGYPMDQHDDDMRSLAFTSSPLDHAIHIAGRPVVTVALTEATTADRCVVKLSDVDDKGRSLLISKGYHDLRSLRRGSEQSCTVRVELDPTCYTLPARHRLRLIVTDSDFPRLWPSGEETTVAVITHRRGPTAGRTSSLTDGKQVTSLRLPLADPTQWEDVDFAAPDRPASVRPRRSPPEHWEVARDLERGTVRVGFDTTMSGHHIRGSAKLWKRHMAVSVATGSPTQDQPSLIASGTDWAETETGSAIEVTSRIEMGTDYARLTVSTRVDQCLMAERTWSLSQ
ncbi:hypothetical protein B0I33_102214 [Prauserella shujinwangii]|uniref:Xaa-Pro dipeptidyl-peptidase C-terminal domain-containing protein n=1 Tax=Prauserella shujinwangii TaxID=1453103 RepID=A0A2T0M0F8_9PSEU|nr:CocE/NonD family hydrolase [Prauserella shujinwangii]PRX50096.1 hypothetical protein B0I33_102214 [Prauserella shujinwangii]